VFSSKDEARSQGVTDVRQLTPEENGMRTAAMTTLETVGEMLGIPGMKILMKGIPLTGSPGQIVNYVKNAALAMGNEQLSELATTVAQFSVDKFADFGLNKNASFDDFKQALQDTVLATTAAVGSASGIATAYNSAAGRNTSAISDAQRTAVTPDLNASLFTQGADFGAKAGDTTNQGVNPITSDAIDFMAQDPDSQRTILDGIKNRLAGASIAATMALGSPAGATDTTSLSSPTDVTAVSSAPATVDTGTDFVSPFVYTPSATPSTGIDITSAQNAVPQASTITQAPVTTQTPAAVQTPTNTQAPITQAPTITQAPATQAPVTQVSATQAPATQAPTITQAPTTQVSDTQAPATTQTPATTANTVATAASTSVSNSLKAGADAPTAITTAINNVAKTDGNVNSAVAPIVTAAINAGVDAPSAVANAITASVNAGGNVSNSVALAVTASVQAGTTPTAAIDAAVQVAVANGMSVADATSIAVQAATPTNVATPTNIATPTNVALATNVATPTNVTTPTNVVTPSSTTVSPLSTAVAPTTVAVAPTTTVAPTTAVATNIPTAIPTTVAPTNIVTSPLATVTQPPVIGEPPPVEPPPVAPPTVSPPPVTQPPVKTPPKTTEPPKKPTHGGGLSFAIADQKLDSSPQFLKGAPKEKAMQLAALKQLYNSLTPEMQEIFAAQGIRPPEEDSESERESEKDTDKKSKKKDDSEKTYEEWLAEQESKLTPEQLAEKYSTKFAATGGEVKLPEIKDAFNPNLKTIQSMLAAAPITEAPFKLSGLKHLKQSISKAPRAVSEYAQGGLPTKYAKAAPKGHNPEFITGLTGYYAQGKGTGQSDDIPAMLHDGDYVIDADAVAALGDGSSKAGAEALSQFQNKVPHKMSTGGQAVPAKIADGEYVFPEAFVTAIGGGDNKQGSKLLDAMREELRAHKRSAPTSKIPPKAKSPLDYLRMAKG
jgi:hypothetical protein